jgi:glyoxylase-like metal-dependent hydrolase (beta-lactamase superfamily II)
LRSTIAIRSAIFAQLQTSPMLLPNVTFDQELNIDLGNRVVELRHSGIGDTLGDVWVYLPKERILVTGDVLTAPVPYFFAGYPAALAKTLRHLLELDVTAIIPGHGDVMHDKAYMQAVADLMATVITEVNAAIVRTGSLSSQLADIRKQLGTRVDIAKYRRQFAGDDPGSQEYFDECIEGLIKDAFYQSPK